MAHLPAAWPEQTLCKENKRKAIGEQQRKWMEQRNAALRQEQQQQQQTMNSMNVEGDEHDDPDELAELEGINEFLATVGQALADDSPSTRSGVQSLDGGPSRF